MWMVHKIFALGYASIVALFTACGFALIGYAALEIWQSIDPNTALATDDRFNALLEGVGLLTIAVAALELGQTILEEEVQREAQMSAPTRVRRFLSRFLVVVIVSLAIESLVGVFQFLHGDPAQLPHAAMVGLTAAALLAGWGVFIKLNKSAEEIEPEAMEEAKQEDEKVGAGKNASARSSERGRGDRTER